VVNPNGIGTDDFEKSSVQGLTLGILMDFVLKILPIASTRYVIGYFKTWNTKRVESRDYKQRGETEKPYE
jgi:hypothetical protein